jgi:hypothetical protein
MAPMIRASLRALGLGLFAGAAARWAKFLAEEITPRFRNGLTVSDGKGQWRAPDRRAAAHERSKIVLLVTSADEAARDQISAIVSAYKRRFRQQSVDVLTRRVCASF